MLTKKLMSKSALLVLVLLVAGVSAGHIRTLLWDDPLCSQWSADGTCCLCCAYRSFMNKYGKCQAVSDWCKTWDNKTGCCTSCYQGYGEPVNGVCASAPPVNGGKNCTDDGNTGGNVQVNDPYCRDYQYVDSANRYYKSWFNGCKKVCVCCVDGYYLNYNNKCVALPKYCEQADKYGKCVDCKDGYHVDNFGCCVANPDDNCAEYGYVDAGNKWLNQWANGCKKVCKCCDKGFYLTCNYTCVALPKNCDAADAYGKCTCCSYGFVLDKFGCCVPKVDEDNCAHCAEYGYIDYAKNWVDRYAQGCKKVCKCCEKVYYLTCNYTCAELPYKCEKANQWGQCTCCIQGYHLDATGCCVPDVKVIDHCKEYGYVDKNKNWLAAWATGCNRVCKCCEKGYYLTADGCCALLPKNCKEADIYGNCKCCEDGYHLDNGKCVEDCDDHCEAYGYIDSYKKWYDKAFAGCKKVCKCCEKGYYLTCDYTCAPLPYKCKEADAYGKCTCCEEGFHPDAKGCCVADVVVSDPNCKEWGYVDSNKNWLAKWVNGCKKVCKCCKDGFYLDCDNVCQKYPDHCDAVDAKGNCTCCEDGFKLINGKCCPKPKEECPSSKGPQGHAYGKDKGKGNGQNKIRY